MPSVDQRAKNIFLLIEIFDSEREFLTIWFSGLSVSVGNWQSFGLLENYYLLLTLLPFVARERERNRGKRGGWKSISKTLNQFSALGK